MTYDTQTTVFALATSPGRAGVAVVRVSGPRAADVIEKLTGDLPEARVATLRSVRDPHTGDVLDRGMVVWFPAPKSFTGEDVVELHLHGGRAVIDAVLHVLSSLPGLMLAGPGDFTRRAFENGKLDLAEVEGLADLIDAETEAQRKQALAQASGHLSAVYEGWRERLIEALGLAEAAIDFSDEGDVGDRAFSQARLVIDALSVEVNDHLNDGHRGEILRDGFRVALVGAPNVGKSSLLNALARRDAAIVSAEAGTTRDVIEVRLDLNGYPVVISDTAGVRETDGLIEQEGIRRTYAVAQDAELILWLTDPTSFGDDLPDELHPLADKVIHVVNKVDLLDSETIDHLSDDTLAISVKIGAGVDRLQERLATVVGERLAVSQSPALTQSRHRLLITQCADGLAQFLAGDAGDVELRAEDLRHAAHALGRVTGRVDVEEILDQVFGRFCIGK